MQKFDGRLGEFDVEHLIEKTVELANDESIFELDWNADRGWLFQLARRIQREIKIEDRKRGGAFYSPFALLFIEEVSQRYVLPLTHINWSDAGQVEMVFEAMWTKVRFAEGEELVDVAINKAKQVPCTRLLGLKGMVASACYYLQEATGKSFFLPVNDGIAELFKVSKMALGLAINALEGSGMITQLRAHVPNVKARVFRFETNHDDVLPGFRK